MIFYSKHVRVLGKVVRVFQKVVRVFPESCDREQGRI